MVTFVRQWIVERELLRLAKRESFQGIDPQAITLVLEQFARMPSRLSATERQSCMLRALLLDIWENASERYHAEKNTAWLRVTASCNALYEQHRSHEDRSNVEALAA